MEVGVVGSVAGVGLFHISQLLKLSQARVHLTIHVDSSREANPRPAARKLKKQILIYRGEERYMRTDIAISKNRYRDSFIHSRQVMPLLLTVGPHASKVYPKKRQQKRTLSLPKA